MESDFPESARGLLTLRTLFGIQSVGGSLEEQIARFMLRVSKFEFYLVNADRDLARTISVKGLDIIAGINWSRLAQRLESRQPFSQFDFGKSPFGIFKDTAPQYLIKRSDGRLTWDSDDEPIESWERFITRSFAQLRNNVAHGNKGQMTAPFTHDRTEKFLRAGFAFIEFIAEEVFGDPTWETPIAFR